MPEAAHTEKTGTQARERPILFSGVMVKAILEGRKTMTRRVIKITDRTPGLAACLLPKDPAWVRPNVAVELCPYGKPGDRLWVRETWAYFGGDEYLYQQEPKSVAYRADHTGLEPVPGGRWRPSIFMPRWASRITLEITHVRVERLASITYKDAISEGMPDFATWQIASQEANEGETMEQTARRLRWPERAFARTWCEINGPESWDLNPWVSVIEFKTLEAPCKPTPPRR